ncbi:MAG TPA: hemolysin family protein [Vicinamibacterales bacterium]
MHDELLLVFLLLVANGIFAMAEIAVVASRRVRLERRAESGDRKAARALALKQKPTDFLSTVQFGITLVGIFAGAFGGPRFAPPVAAQLEKIEPLAPYADVLALTIVVILLTYASLVIGELVPKAVALAAPERIAAAIAQPFAVLSRMAAPVVRLLSASTAAILWLLRVPRAAEPAVTEEEIRALIKQAAVAGELEPVEQEIVDKVFRLGDRRVSSIMTPRPDIDWVDVRADQAELREAILRRRSRLVVCDGDLDHVLGVVHTGDLLVQLLETGRLDIRAAIRPPLFVPETLDALVILERFRTAHTHVALVIDEHGAVEGLITLSDLLRSIFGDLPESPATEAGPIVRRPDGSWLVDGSVPLEELRHVIPLPPGHEEEDAGYETLAGLVMQELSRLPEVGDRIDLDGFTLEVIDMDGRRVDKVLVQQHPPKPGDSAASTG